MDIQRTLGVTPRGTIHHSEGVRMVKLFKESQATRLGIIFHQNTPAEVNNVDMTPRNDARGPVVIPVIKVRPALDPP